MNVIRKFTLKSLKQNKKRTVVTIIGIIISAAMLTAVTVFVSSFVSMVQRSAIADGGNWHTEIKGVPAENVSVITESKDVDKAILSRDLGYASFGSDNYSKPYVCIREYSAEGFDQMSVRLVSGRLPERSGEAVISESIDKTSGVKLAIGDTLDLQAGRRIGEDGATVFDENTSFSFDVAPDGTRTVTETFVPADMVKYTVVGVIEPPSFEYSWSAGYGVIGYLDPSLLSPNDTVNVYFTASSIDRGIYDRVASLAEQANAAKGNITFNNELLRYYGVLSYDNVYSFIQVFVTIIILIIIAASVSLIYNAFAISVSERSKQLGLLASVGATKRQKRGSVYFEGFFLGLIGIPVGIAAGIAGIGITLAAIQPLLDSFLYLDGGVKLTLIVPLWAVAATVALSALTIFVSAWLPAKRASKITPIDAIRQTREIRLSHRAVKTSRFTRRLFGFEAEIALKNLKRSRKKYRATIVSLVISLVLFLTVSSYTQVTGNIAGVSSEGYNYDISVSYSVIPEQERDKLDGSIISLGNVKDHTEMTQLTGTIALNEEDLSDYAKMYNIYDVPENNKVDFNVNIVCLDNSSFSRYAQAAGVNAREYTDPRSPKAILINHGQDYLPAEQGVMKKAAGDILNLKPGRHVAFSPASSPAQRFDFTVGAITKERPMGIFIQNFTSAAFVVSKPVFDELTSGLNGQDVSNDIQRSTFLTSDNDQSLEKSITDLTQDNPAVSYVHNIRSASRSQQNMQMFLGIFVYGFIILISLICIANIFNTISTNIALRRREFAMLRSVGMSPKGFNRMIRFESIFYGLKGLLYGLPLSVAVAYLLFGMERSVLETSFALPWASYGFAVAMILIIVLVTMWYSASKIKKENILDALKEENT